MLAEFSKHFVKEYRDISHLKGVAESVNEIIENVIQSKITSEIRNLKKLSGFKFYYRIRLGDYRIGLKIEKDTVIFATIQHRKDIYKKFPK